MSDIDTQHLLRAFEIAFSTLGTTTPNPSVGAVVVKNGKVLSTGSTNPCGFDHAEVMALKGVSDARGADLYVSLEPCCHHGKTPPCTDSIIKSGISRVIIPLLDPNPLVAGNGVKRLQQAGIEVIIAEEMAHYAADLIRHFKKFIIKKKSFVIHKTAMTLDGKTATRGGDSKWISSDCSRYIVHRLRNIVDAIIVGKGTFVTDDPALTVRNNSFPDEVKDYFCNTRVPFFGKDNLFLKMLVGPEEITSRRQPTRVMIGLPPELDFSKKFFSDDNYIIFSDIKKRDHISRRDDSAHLSKIENEGRFVFVDGESRREQVTSVLRELYSRDKAMLLVEGGGQLAGSFFDAGEVDQFLYFIAPRIAGGGLPSLDGTGFNTMKESLQLQDITTGFIKEDILINAYREQY